MQLTKIEKAGLQDKAIELMGKGMDNKQIAKELDAKPNEVNLFRKRVLKGVIETSALDNAKPVQALLAEKYLQTDELLAESFKEIAERMSKIKGDADWLEFMKEKRAFIQLLMQKAGELNKVNNAIQVNVQNMISPEQFTAKANDYLFSLVRAGKVILQSPELLQEYERWGK